MFFLNSATGFQYIMELLYFPTMPVPIDFFISRFYDDWASKPRTKPSVETARHVWILTPFTAKPYRFAWVGRQCFHCLDKTFFKTSGIQIKSSKFF